VTEDGDPFGTTISIYVDDEPTPGVDVRISCAWSIAGKAEGEIRTRVNLPAGETSETQLAEGVTVKASFNAVQRQADQLPEPHAP
jgi:hypothetical protein